MIATCSKWTTYWILETSNPESVTKSMTIRKMMDAVWVTPAMVVLVIYMDKLADAGLFDDTKAEGVISVCGLVTGLAWEQCYSSSMRTISHSSDAPTLTTVFIGFGLVA